LLGPVRHRLVVVPGERAGGADHEPEGEPVRDEAANDVDSRPLDAADAGRGHRDVGLRGRRRNEAFVPGLRIEVQECGSVSALTLPADNGTWSVSIVTSSRDTALRHLRDPRAWTAVVKMLPTAAHWIDAPPLGRHVGMIAKIEDRIRDYAPGGHAVATGVLAVGDSWSCTNPSLGRGISLGFMHAVLLRDHLHDSPVDDPSTLASTWWETTHDQMEPWYRTTHNYDRHRLAEMDAISRGAPFTPTNQEWNRTRSLRSRILESGEFLRANVEIAMALRRADEVLDDPGLREHLDECAPAESPRHAPRPTRAELLATLGS
jgi:2-polyprenyl-6-methoxyphenol hydroxylase-like FAD-dependent oxidoreductase